jgi:integrase
MADINLNFNLKNPETKNESPIRLVVRWRGNQIITSTGESINPQFWFTPKKDAHGKTIRTSNQRAKIIKDNPTATKLNKRLDDIEHNVKRLYSDLKKVGDTVTKNELKKELDIYFGRSTRKDIPRDFKGYIDYLIASKEGLINPKTKRLHSTRTFSKYRYVRTVCNEIDPYIEFKDFTENFYSQKFEKHLIAKNQSLNTIGKYSQTLKSILAVAYKDGIHKNQYYKDYPVHREETVNIYLNESEIDQLFDLDLSHIPHLDRVRDMFVIGTQTGLRFSDLYAIKKHHINGDVITLKTFKTGTTVEIPIFPKTRAVLEKYNYELPDPISNQKFNEYIKEVGKRAGFDTITRKAVKRATGEDVNHKKKYELITTHTMRRSFCTNLYLADYPILGICKISGHATETEFIKYVKVTKKENAKSLLEFMRERENQTIKMHG